MSQNLVYAELGPHVCSSTRPSHSQIEKVQYASLLHDAIVKQLPASDPKENAGRNSRADNYEIMHVLLHASDSSVNLDQILIQLKEVVPHWRKLAERVGLEDLNRIAEHVRKTNIIILYIFALSVE